MGFGKLFVISLANSRVVIFVDPSVSPCCLPRDYANLQLPLAIAHQDVVACSGSPITNSLSMSLIP